jgi:nicotinate dehydrogenase subunit A
VGCQRAAGVLKEVRAVTIDFELNGESVRLEADPKLPLLYALRNDCHDTGARFGCGTGHCGACTVMVDGMAEQSCNVPAAIAAGKSVCSPEGLDAHPVGALVLQAFQAERAAQCGYCINGLMMSLTALLTVHPAPADAVLIEVLNRHLCRCGTHLRIARAARRAIALLGQKAQQ